MTIPLEPFGASRTRARAQPTQQYRGRERVWIAQVYKDVKYRRWMDEAIPWFMEDKPDVPLEGPLAMHLLTLSPHRKSDERKTRAVPRMWMDTRPDFDNVMKAVADCAEAAGYFKDDGQICRVVFEQVRAGEFEEPCIHVTFRELGEYGCGSPVTGATTGGAPSTSNTPATAHVQRSLPGMSEASAPTATTGRKKKSPAPRGGAPGPDCPF